MYGFAARCEAAALPRRMMTNDSGLRPSFGLWPEQTGAEPEPRAQPVFILPLSAGQSHRLTSSGRAEAYVQDLRSPKR